MAASASATSPTKPEQQPAVTQPQTIRCTWGAYGGDEHWQDHDEFHERQFDQIFELCSSCLGMVIEGPWEPVYSIIKAKMPDVRSMGQIADLANDLQKEKEFVRFATPQRCVAIAEHTVAPGKEKAFEKGAIETMEALSDSTGFLGYMILKQIQHM